MFNRKAGNTMAIDQLSPQLQSVETVNGMFPREVVPPPDRQLE